MADNRILCVLLTALCCTGSPNGLTAEEPSLNPFDFRSALGIGQGEIVFNYTLGGRQFWGDVQCFHDWRIQRNVFTGHYRLLDGSDRRHASGTLEVCREKLAQIRKTSQLPPMSGRAVILLHGIFRSSHAMRWIGDQVVGDDALPLSLDYPSTQISISAAAEYVDSVVSQLDGIDQIDFVCHSLGGLVLRAYLAEHADPRIRRIVMIGTPNQGAEMADLLQGFWLYRGLFGPAGRELNRDPEGIIPKLPVPPMEFAVIAGARGVPDGWNLLIPGDDDGTVTVASTRLVGAADFVTVPVLHSFLISDPQVAEMTDRFLREGRLRADGNPEPIVEIQSVEDR
ncbi:MAG: alpha/beta fold hydrolase [Planctomycetaceae bacterium]